MEKLWRGWRGLVIAITSLFGAVVGVWMGAYLHYLYYMSWASGPIVFTAVLGVVAGIIGVIVGLMLLDNDSTERRKG